jgi:hypothetical protein
MGEAKAGTVEGGDIRTEKEIDVIQIVLGAAETVGHRTLRQIDREFLLARNASAPDARHDLKRKQAHQAMTAAQNLAGRYNFGRERNAEAFNDCCRPAGTLVEQICNSVLVPHHWSCCNLNAASGVVGNRYIDFYLQALRKSYPPRVR